MLIMNKLFLLCYARVVVVTPPLPCRGNSSAPFRGRAVAALKGRRAITLAPAGSQALSGPARHCRALYVSCIRLSQSLTSSRCGLLHRRKRISRGWRGGTGCRMSRRARQSRQIVAGTAPSRVVSPENYPRGPHGPRQEQTPPPPGAGAWAGAATKANQVADSLARPHVSAAWPAPWWQWPAVARSGGDDPWRGGRSQVPASQAQ